MADQNITESINEANDILVHLQEYEDLDKALNTIERILKSCRVFLNPPQSTEFEKYIEEKEKEFDKNWEAAQRDINKEKDGYMKFLKKANFIVNLRINYLDRMNDYLSKMNQKL
jgi:F0F1-type ATP synthase membrane subunit b/b'